MSVPRWTAIERDRWGGRSQRQCPSCLGKTFQVIKEKEREKKHRGKRADRIVVVCANMECSEHKDAKARRVGWPVKRGLK